MNSYAFVEQEREEKEEMKKLTTLGTYLIPPTLVAGFFGMNVFGGNSFKVDNYVWMAVAVIAMVVSPSIVAHFMKKEKK